MGKYSYFLEEKTNVPKEGRGEMPPVTKGISDPWIHSYSLSTIMVLTTGTEISTHVDNRTGLSHFQAHNISFQS